MNCQAYTDLSIMEQRQLIGSIIHLLQNDSNSFIAISSMVRNAESEGLFEGVKIMPPAPDKHNETFNELIN